MLVLTRRAGQLLRIGDSIDLRVIRIEGDRVVLGIAAPTSVRVVRGELLDAVSDEVRKAGAMGDRVRELLGPQG
jgi:carbon storage regulator